jgi:hypothetical protein
VPPMTTLRTARPGPFLGSFVALLMLACSADEPPRGELMLSVLTDMAVPNDIDRVFWSITLDGAEASYRSGVVSLDSGSDLPLTLAIEAGPETTAPITVRVEGRKGDSPWLLRVAREAKLAVPQDRVAKLELPLSWLCSGANLSEPCGAGFTCQAGHCVDATVATAALPDFEPSPPRDCFDVTACIESATFKSPAPLTLESGRKVPCAVIGMQPLGPLADVKVALQVRNEEVGNYGFCGPFAECFIPLRREETAEGWRVLDNGDIPTIELPAAVCENSQTSVAQVAIVEASLLCPSDLDERALCPPELAEGCLELEENAALCPMTPAESDWVAYACTDVSPKDLYADLLDCWAADPSSQDGRWCCLKGQAAGDDPLLIDDMQGGPQIKLAPPEGHFAGWWHTEIPEGSGDLWPSPSKSSLYTYRQFAEPVGPPGGPQFNAAACLSSQGFHGWLALQSFFLASKLGSYGAVAIDVRDYAGISFWGWAYEQFPNQPLSVAVSFPNVDTSQQGTCAALDPPEDAGSRCDNFAKEVALTGEWTRYVVRWEELAQDEYDWGQIRFDHFEPQIENIEFSVAGADPPFMSPPFEFCVTDIRFEPKEAAP